MKKTTLTLLVIIFLSSCRNKECQPCPSLPPQKTFIDRGISLLYFKPGLYDQDEVNYILDILKLPSMTAIMLDSMTARVTKDTIIFTSQRKEIKQ